MSNAVWGGGGSTIKNSRGADAHLCPSKFKSTFMHSDMDFFVYGLVLKNALISPIIQVQI